VSGGPSTTPASAGTVPPPDRRSERSGRRSVQFLTKLRVAAGRRLVGRLAALSLALLAAPAHAVLPDEELADPRLEARARHLSQELRCLVCQNQDIDSSDAPLARDLRLLVRERLAKGDSDSDARAYIVARYGNFVLLKPPVEGATLALWYGPAAFVLLGGVGAWAMLRRRRAIPEAAPLTPAELARVDTLLATDEHGRA